MKIVATTSLPAVDRPNADRWNAAGSRQKNTSLAAKRALANRLQRRTACKIQNGHQGAPKWLTGSGKVFTPMFWAFKATFAK